MPRKKTASKRAPKAIKDPAADTLVGEHGVVIGLSAVIVTVQNERPYVLVVSRPASTARGKIADYFGLPFGPFDPQLHRTIEISLCTWVEEQTYLDLGYVEQLYTFGDRGREGVGAPGDSHIISIGYLALTRGAPKLSAPDSVWHDWYRYFPWEDWRDVEPSLLDEKIKPALSRWADSTKSKPVRSERRERARLCFGFNGIPWDEEKVLERYELLYEAGLVGEAARDLRAQSAGSSQLGESMTSDHRRILATAMGRLRGKLKYRPVVFELMPPTFTLLQLQRTVEAISGVRLHKQNFRRLVEKEGLVEGTGILTAKTGGRPAERFRFRREVMMKRPTPGFRVGVGRR